MKWLTWKKGIAVFALAALFLVGLTSLVQFAKADDDEGYEHEGYEHERNDHDEGYEDEGYEGGGYDSGWYWDGTTTDPGTTDTGGVGTVQPITVSWKEWNRDVTDYAAVTREKLPLQGPKKITVQIDGQSLTGIWAHTSNGELLLPVNALLPAFPVKAEWYGKEKILVLRGNGENLIVKVDRNVAHENGVKVAIPHAPLMIGNDLYLPVSLLSTAFQMKADWSDKEQKITFTTVGNGGVQ